MWGIEDVKDHEAIKSHEAEKRGEQKVPSYLVAIVSTRILGGQRILTPYQKSVYNCILGAPKPMGLTGLRRLKQNNTHC